MYVVVCALFVHIALYGQSRGTSEPFLKGHTKFMMGVQKLDPCSVKNVHH